VTPALRARAVTKSFEGPVLRGVDLDVPAGALVALLGPSGCGKTTLLRLVAGFERVDGGTIEIAGRPVVGPGLDLAPEKRHVGVVPQEGALFPHLSVRDNVAFGLPRPGRRSTRVDELLELVGLPDLGDRMPHELSGGQQQRVAVARALAPGPSLVLLDEPFSALDAGLRAQVRAEVRASLREAGASGLLVTHDQQEALSTADVVAVVRDGRVVQAAEPWEIYAHPADLGVATFVGEAIVLSGEAGGDVVESPLGRLAPLRPAHGGVDIVVRPEQVEIDPPDLSVVDAEVVERFFYGHDALLRLRLPGGASITARTPGHPLPAIGSSVRVGCRGAVVTFPTSK
jgi:iron(III) transport system ATP-binding protein